MMCMKDFVSVDMFVRKLLVEQGDECDDDEPLSEGEGSERSVDEESRMTGDPCVSVTAIS